MKREHARHRQRQNELEKETKERRAELQRYERRVLSKEENLDKKSEAMEKREAGLNAREESLKKKTAETEALYEKGMEELEKISGLTSEQAREYLLKSVEEDVKHDTAKRIKDLEGELQKIIDEYNKTAPLYKRVFKLKVRDVEFEKNTTKKIKRF